MGFSEPWIAFAWSDPEILVIPAQVEIQCCRVGETNQIFVFIFDGGFSPTLHGFLTFNLEPGTFNLEP